LLGGAGNSSPHADAIATRVLVKGEPVPAPAGRADDFMLQRSNDEPTPPASAIPAGAVASAPAEPAPIPEQKPSAPQTNSKATQTTQAAQTSQGNQGAKPKPQPQRTQHRDDVPRPPRGIFPSGGSPFGLFRF